jgi:hypothetical protein
LSPCPSFMCQECRHRSCSEPLVKLAGVPGGTGSTSCTFPVAVAEVSQGSCGSFGAWGPPLRQQSSGRSSSFTATAAAGGLTAAGGSAASSCRRSHSLDNTAQQLYQQQLRHLAVVEGSAGSGETSAVSTSLTSHPNPSARQVSTVSSTQQDSRSIWPWARSSSPIDISLTAAAAVPSFAVSTATASAAAEPASAPAAAASSSRKSVVGSKPRNLLQQLLGPKQDQQALFSGLRVRMGVVTGEVMRGQEVKSSDLYRRAQGMSARHGAWRVQ